MADELSFPTGLGTSDADSIRLMGQDLAHDLIGKVGFGELAFWLVAGRRPAADWFDALIKIGVPCGPINTVDQGVAFAEQIGLDPVVISGHGDAGVATVRHPLTFSVTPPRYDLPPPQLDEHGDQIRGWLASDPDREEAS